MSDGVIGVGDVPVPNPAVINSSPKTYARGLSFEECQFECDNTHKCQSFVFDASGSYENHNEWYETLCELHSLTTGVPDGTYDSEDSFFKSGYTFCHRTYKWSYFYDY